MDSVARVTVLKASHKVFKSNDGKEHPYGSVLVTDGERFLALPCVDGVVDKFDTVPGDYAVTLSINKFKGWHVRISDCAHCDIH